MIFATCLLGFLVARSIPLFTRAICVPNVSRISGAGDWQLERKWRWRWEIGFKPCEVWTFSVMMFELDGYRVIVIVKWCETCSIWNEYEIALYWKLLQRCSLNVFGVGQMAWHSLPYIYIYICSILYRLFSIFFIPETYFERVPICVEEGAT